MSSPVVNRIDVLEHTAEAVLALAGIPVGDRARVVPMQSGNTVVEVATGDESFFLKVPTKDLEEWADPLDGAAQRVVVEVTAFAFLKARELSTVEVVDARTDLENPLGRPYLLTRRVRGRDFTEVVPVRARDGWSGPLQAVGAFLRKVHAISFDTPGLIVSSQGPGGDAPPGARIEQDSAVERVRHARADLESARPVIPASLFTEIEQHLATLTGSAAIESPRFRLGGFHPNHAYLVREKGQWAVSACIDLDGSSGGDVTDDLMTFGVGMMFRSRPDVPWWDSLFEGYGREWSFERTRWELLATCRNWFEEFGDLAGTYRRLLDAGSWSELFNAHRVV